MKIHPSQILNPTQFSSVVGGSSLLWVEARNTYGKTNVNPSGGTALGNNPSTLPIDLSGNNTISQTTATDRPTYNNTDGNYWNFDGTDILNVSNLTLIKNSTSLLVGFRIKLNTATTSDRIISISTAGNTVLIMQVVVLNSLAANNFLTFRTYFNPTSDPAQNITTMNSPNNIYKIGEYFNFIASYNPVLGICKHYINGVLIAIFTGLTTSSSFANIDATSFQISGQAATNMMNGRLKSMIIHKNGNYTDDAVLKLNNYLISTD